MRESVSATVTASGYGAAAWLPRPPPGSADSISRSRSSGCECSEDITRSAIMMYWRGVGVCTDLDDASRHDLGHILSE
jgi:hypothetical protein